MDNAENASQHLDPGVCGRVEEHLAEIAEPDVAAPALSPSERAELLESARKCPACKELLGSYEMTIGLLRALPGRPAPADFVDRVRGGIAASETPRAGSRQRTAERRPSSVRKSLWTSPWLGSMAAAMALFFGVVAWKWLEQGRNPLGPDLARDLELAVKAPRKTGKAAEPGDGPTLARVSPREPTGVSWDGVSRVAHRSVFGRDGGLQSVTYQLDVASGTGANVLESFGRKVRGHFAAARDPDDDEATLGVELDSGTTWAENNGERTFLVSFTVDADKLDGLAEELEGFAFVSAPVDAEDSGVDLLAEAPANPTAPVPGVAAPVAEDAAPVAGDVAKAADKAAPGGVGASAEALKVASAPGKARGDEPTAALRAGGRSAPEPRVAEDLEARLAKGLDARAAKAAESPDRRRFRSSVPAVEPSPESASTLKKAARAPSGRGRDEKKADLSVVEGSQRLRQIPKKRASKPAAAAAKEASSRRSEADVVSPLPPPRAKRKAVAQTEGESLPLTRRSATRSAAPAPGKKAVGGEAEERDRAGNVVRSVSDEAPEGERSKGSRSANKSLGIVSVGDDRSSVPGDGSARSRSAAKAKKSARGESKDVKEEADEAEVSAEEEVETTDEKDAEAGLEEKASPFAAAPKGPRRVRVFIRLRAGSTPR